MDRETLDRRTVLKTMAAGAATATIAGCSSGGAGGGGNDGSDGTSGGSGGRGDGGGSGGTSNSASNAVSFDGWFENTSNFDGVVDETGNSEVTVTVGSEGNNGNYAFGPAAVTVTTVVWEWTGKGSLHNVVADNGDFESQQTQEAGHTFSYTFDSTGTYKYYCTPHEAMGMKGAIVVE